MPSRRRRRRRARPAPRPFFRRRSTLWLVAASVTLAVGILLGVLAERGGGGDSGEPAPTPTLAVALPPLVPDPARLERADVLRVIDGDTIEVRIGRQRERIRYYGVDTPERGERCYREAADRNEALAGGSVLLLPDVRERDRGGRLLRYAFDEEGQSIDARLVAEGLARAWPDDGAYRDALVALEGEVRRKAVGCLWE